MGMDKESHTRRVDVRPMSELLSDDPMFGREESEFALRDAAAYAAWPYPIPEFDVPDMVVRFAVGLYPIEGEYFKTPSWMHILLCPPGATPENTSPFQTERKGIIRIAYSRLIHDRRVSWGYRLAKGWKHPEFVSGGQLSKTVRVFHAPTLAADGFVINVSYSDNPRHRSRQDALEIVNRALVPFRNPEMPGFPPLPPHDPRLEGSHSTRPRGSQGSEPSPAERTPIDPGDAPVTSLFSPFIKRTDDWGVWASDLLAIKPVRSADMHDLLAHLAVPLNGTVPTQKWLKRTADLLDAVPARRGVVQKLLEGAVSCPRGTHTWRVDQDNGDVIRGLIWAATVINAPSLIQTLIGVIEMDRPSRFVVDRKLLNAAYAAIGHVATPEARSALQSLRARTTDRGYLGQIDRALEKGNPGLRVVT